MVDSLALYDRTARRAHQWSMVGLVLVGLVVGGSGGGLLLGLAAVVMLLGRFWWPADVVRQLVWRVLEPASLLRRDDVPEDHATRRIARVIGGSVWLLASLAMLLGNAVLAWILTVPIAAMVALDAAFDFCALCFLAARIDRYRALPGA